MFQLTRVLFFGDSNTYGAWDVNGGWVDRLKKEAHKETVKSSGKIKLQFLNLGIGGDSSVNIIKRMPSEIEARVSGGWNIALVFNFGKNDERSTNGAIHTPLPNFESNTREIITLARKYTQKILFLGIPPLGRNRVTLKGNEYSDERVLQYDALLRRIVQIEEILFIELRPAFEKADRARLYFEDLIHPNHNGHALITKTVKPQLWKLLGI